MPASDPPRAALVALAGALCLCACQPPHAPKTEEIVVDALVFGPAPQDLRAGDSVRWVNRDIFEHSATAKDGAFDVDLKPGASGEAVMTRPGVVSYYCRFHPGMTGQIAVGP
jgi:plastocyanin